MSHVSGMCAGSTHKEVLIGVLKSPRDLAILQRKRWYRAPMSHIPVRGFEYVAFYQPAVFGREGKKIRYFAKVESRRTSKRVWLLPDEHSHPRAGEKYARIRIKKLKELDPPICNSSPRRVSFGFTTMALLLRAKNILQLYEVAETEEILYGAMRHAGLKPLRQAWVTGEGRSARDAKRHAMAGRRYRLDFALLCARGKIAIECDNKKAHTSKRQLARDIAKDDFLRRHGWHVMRFIEEEIVLDAKRCARKIKKLAQKLGVPR